MNDSMRREIYRFISEVPEDSLEFEKDPANAGKRGNRKNMLKWLNTAVIDEAIVHGCFASAEEFLEVLTTLTPVERAVLNAK